MKRRYSLVIVLVVSFTVLLGAEVFGARVLLDDFSGTYIYGQVTGCRMFPYDNIWNFPINDLPVDANSDAYINTIGSDTGLHPDFGSGLWEGAEIGIPYVAVPGTQAKVTVTFDYDDESDPGPYPIPPDAPIEGGPDGDGDRHVLVLDKDNCYLYELFYAFPQEDGSWTAGSGAIYNLSSHDLRTDGWTSADAAGLPILPGLILYDEVMEGEIDHALRFTAPETRNTHVWPARHDASSLSGNQYPPMGQRFRLKAEFDISPFSADIQVILKALKEYGMFLADNGSSWFLSGEPNERWDNDMLSELNQVHGSDFEAVDISSVMVDPNSGRVKVPVSLLSQVIITYNGNLATDFGTYGLYSYDGSAWTQISTSDADNTGNTMAAYNTGLAVDFGTSGLYYYNGTSWSQISTNNPEWLAAYSDKLVADFGSTWGMWQYDGTSWSQISTSDADNTGNTMVAYDNGLAVDFGSLGLWYYNGTSWSQISTNNPEWLAAYNGNLVGDFGATYGLYSYNGSSWTQISTSDADNTGNTMVVYNTGLAVDFGTAGLYYYNGTSWSQISTNNPQWLTAYNGNLAVDFGTYGLYSYNGSTWTRISTADADNTGNTMVSCNNGLAVDFGTQGLYYYNDAAWSQISTHNAELAAYNGSLVADFGNTWGLWQYDGSAWSQISIADPDN